MAKLVSFHKTKLYTDQWKVAANTQHILEVTFL